MLVDGQARFASGAKKSFCSAKILKTIVKSELVVNVEPQEITTAFVEDGRLAEINREPRDMGFAVGNIYYGRVKKIMPALNAAFVDVGCEKDAFLHYLDLGSNFNSLNDYTKQVVSDKKRLPPFPKNAVQPIVSKLGTIEDVLEVGQPILVQVTKEPINTKGPRLTSEISIAGRYLVLIPFADKIMVSNKIKGETEKNRLRKMVNAIKPKGYGVIIRTIAANIQQEDLQKEMNVLYKRWEDAILKLQRSEPVSLISAEIGRTVGIIRDVFNPSFDHIYVNDKDMYQEIKDYVELIAPEQNNIVQLYKGDQPIFDHFDITRQSKIGLGRTVSFKNGGYLVMEKTEALFVIDVNSGTRKVGEDQEENAFNMNLAAADEIAHQLRLRDIGGIIVVDFIDMAKADNRQKLYEYMRSLMNRDRAKHNVLQLSKFGLMQITRQRVRPLVEINVDEICPTCHGKGKVQSSFLFSDQLEELVPQMISKYGKDIKLYVHPYVYDHLTKGWIFSIKAHWRLRYGLKKLLEDQSLGFLEYRFVDNKGQIIIPELPQQTPKKLVFDDEQPAKATKQQTAEQKTTEQPQQQKEKPAQPENKEEKVEKVVKNEVKAEKQEKTAQVAPVVEVVAEKEPKKRTRKKKETVADETPKTADKTQTTSQKEAVVEPKEEQPLPEKKTTLRRRTKNETAKKEVEKVEEPKQEAKTTKETEAKAKTAKTTRTRRKKTDTEKEQKTK